MPTGELLFVALVFGAFALFAATLAIVGSIERRWAKARGKA